jgi:hypothetical protein
MSNLLSNPLREDFAHDLRPSARDDVHSKPTVMIR